MRLDDVVDSFAAGSDWPRVWQTRFALSAGDCPRVLKDGTQITIRHILKDRPGHYLEETMGRQNMAVGARAHGIEEFRKVCTSFWKSCLVGGQVSRDDRAKGPPTGQISSHIHLLRLSQKWIATGCVVGVRMAVVAATHGVDEVAAQAYQSPVLLNEVEFDRCDCKSALDPRFALVVVGLSAGRKDELMWRKRLCRRLQHTFWYRHCGAAC
jgi:hypothetical protein